MSTPSNSEIVDALSESAATVGKVRSYMAGSRRVDYQSAQDLIAMRREFQWEEYRQGNGLFVLGQPERPC